MLPIELSFRIPTNQIKYLAFITFKCLARYWKLISFPDHISILQHLPMISTAWTDKNTQDSHCGIKQTKQSLFWKYWIIFIFCGYPKIYGYKICFKVSFSYIIINAHCNAHCNVRKLITIPFLSTVSLWLNNTLHWVSTYTCLREIVLKKMAIHLIWITFHVGVSGFLNFNNKKKVYVIKMSSRIVLSGEPVLDSKKRHERQRLWAGCSWENLRL